VIGSEVEVDPARSIIFVFMMVKAGLVWILVQFQQLQRYYTKVQYHVWRANNTKWNTIFILHLHLNTIRKYILNAFINPPPVLPSRSSLGLYEKSIIGPSTITPPLLLPPRRANQFRTFSSHSAQ
jgi:hypothetical protein